MHLFFHVFTLYQFAIALAQDLIDGCPIYHQQPGLRANFYSYPWKRYGGPCEQKDWFLTGMKRGKYLGSRNGITQPNLKNSGAKQAGRLGKIYGFKLTVSHFAMELIGYYRAPVTGVYTFDLKYCDDGGSFQLGLADFMSCCSQDFDSMVDPDSLVAQWKNSPADGSRIVYMVQGRYYPIRLTFYNLRMKAVFKFLVTKPGESKPSTDFTDTLFGPGGSCVDPPQALLTSTQSPPETSPISSSVKSSQRSSRQSVTSSRISFNQVSGGKPASLSVSGPVSSDSFSREISSEGSMPVSVIQSGKLSMQSSSSTLSISSRMDSTDQSISSTSWSHISSSSNFSDVPTSLQTESGAVSSNILSRGLSSESSMSINFTQSGLLLAHSSSDTFPIKHSQDSSCHSITSSSCSQILSRSVPSGESMKSQSVSGFVSSDSLLRRSSLGNSSSTNIMQSALSSRKFPSSTFSISSRHSFFHQSVGSRPTPHILSSGISDGKPTSSQSVSAPMSSNRLSRGLSSKSSRSMSSTQSGMFFAHSSSGTSSINAGQSFAQHSISNRPNPHISSSGISDGKPTSSQSVSAPMSSNRLSHELSSGSPESTKINQSGERSTHFSISTCSIRQGFTHQSIGSSPSPRNTLTSLSSGKPTKSQLVTTAVSSGPVSLGSSSDSSRSMSTSGLLIVHSSRDTSSSNARQSFTHQSIRISSSSQILLSNVSSGELTSSHFVLGSVSGDSLSHGSSSGSFSSLRIMQSGLSSIHRSIGTSSFGSVQNPIYQTLRSRPSPHISLGSISSSDSLTGFVSGASVSRRSSSESSASMSMKQGGQQLGLASSGSKLSSALSTATILHPSDPATSNEDTLTNRTDSISSCDYSERDLSTAASPRFTITESWMRSVPTTYASSDSVLKAEGASSFITPSTIVIATPRTSYNTATEPWRGSVTAAYSSAVLVTQASGSSLSIATRTTLFSIISEPRIGSVPRIYNSAVPNIETSRNSINFLSNVVVVDTPTTLYSTRTEPWTVSMPTIYTSAVPVTRTSGGSVFISASNVVFVEMSRFPNSTTRESLAGSMSRAYPSTILITQNSGSSVFNTSSSFVMKAPTASCSAILTYTSAVPTIIRNTTVFATSRNKVLVKTPTTRCSTSFNPWSGSVPTTYTSEFSGFRTNGEISSALGLSSKTIVVDTPTAPHSTKTEPWTGSVPITYTSAVPVTKTNGGSVVITASDVVFVKVPTSSHSASTEPSTARMSITYISAVPVTKINSSSEFTTSSNLAVVATPASTYSTMRKTQRWSATTVYSSTDLVTETSKGCVFTTSSSIIVITTPTTPYSTLVETWIGDVPTTYTSAIPVTQTIGSSVITTSFSVIVAETPSTLNSTTTEPCTGTDGTTYTTAIPITSTSGNFVFTTSSDVLVIGTPSTLYGTTTEPGTDRTICTTDVSVMSTSRSSVFTTLSKLDVVKTPTAPYETSVDIWTESEGQSYSTSVLVTSTCGSFGFTTSSKEVTVETPWVPYSMAITCSTGSMPVTCSSTALLTQMTRVPEFNYSSNGVLIRVTEIYSTQTSPCSEGVLSTYPSVVSVSSEGFLRTISTVAAVIGTPSGVAIDPWTASDSTTSTRSVGYTTSPTSSSTECDPNSHLGKNGDTMADRVYESSKVSQDWGSELTKYVTSELHNTGKGLGTIGTHSILRVNGAVCRSFNGLLVSFIGSICLLLL